MVSFGLGKSLSKLTVLVASTGSGSTEPMTFCRFVRVMLRTHHYETENGVEFDRYSSGLCLMKDFELESDGSLDLRKVGQHWGFERASVSKFNSLC